MEKKLILISVMVVLLTSLLIVAFRVSKVQASGTIYIRADGSIDPPTANITSADNVTYTFLGNINESIVVERNNIVVDGAGYMLQGSGSGNGFGWPGINNVTIQNTNIKNFYYGIWLGSSSNNSIMGNNITANNGYGIMFSSSSNNSISGNNITANDWYGVYLSSSSNNSIMGNNITANNEYGIMFYSSSNNSISGNNITANNLFGIMFYSSSNNSIQGNNIANTMTGIQLLFSSNNSISGNTFTDDGLYVLGSYQNSVESNTVNGSPLVYLEGVSNYTVDDAGQVILVRCENIRVEGINLSRTSIGVQLWETDNSTISGNHITANNFDGIWVSSSSNNSISGNNITANNLFGIRFDYFSNYNSISGNNITANNRAGIWLSSSSNNCISGNNIANNGYGIRLISSSSNRIFHNNFINNNQVYSNDSVNIWDNGYPSGGNYWSDYSGVNSDHDGIGDSRHVIDASNHDNYPLMGMFSNFKATSEHFVQTICNSTISEFQHNGTAISFDVTGENGTSGFARICIPKALINETYRVFVNGTEILPSPELLPFSNSTHSYLYFTYPHSTKEVVIIPEVSSFLILPLFMIATLLAGIFCRRRKKVKSTSPRLTCSARIEPSSTGFNVGLF